MQRPHATHIAGFNRWKELGRYVKKGEKGIVIIAPMVLRRKDSEGESEMVVEEETLGHPFDSGPCMCSTCLRPKANRYPSSPVLAGNPNGHTERLKTLIAARSIALEYADDLGGASGISSGGKILIRNGQSPAGEFVVLVHELAHEMLHKTERRKETTRTIRETEAEAVAFVVCQAIGLDTNTASSDYIRMYNGDREAFTESLEHIQKTAATILASITTASEGDDVVGSLPTACSRSV